MGQPSSAHLTDELARQVCQRDGSAAVLAGSIAQIGSQYNLILNAENCATGEMLASAQAVAGDKNHVLDALGTVATSIRGRLGDPGIALNEIVVPLAHLGIARARALSGDKPGARKAYQDFLALWQHADPGIPILQQAKSEYAKLQ